METYRSFLMTITTNRLVVLKFVLLRHAWGTICSDFFDDDDAKVACRQLGYSHLGI